MMQDTERRVMMALWMLKKCKEQEPVRSQKLYFYLMDGSTQEALVLPDVLPARINMKVWNGHRCRDLINLALFCFFCTCFVSFHLCITHVHL